uniref:Uncharacterized protein n=1 Tax=Aegilops tauschii TaxID=37682 RepID=N1QX14_AEGTA
MDVCWGGDIGSPRNVMPCALEVTDKRPKNTSRMRCNGPVGNNDNFFPEDHLIHRPVYGFPDNRDSPFTVLSLGHSSDWKLAPFSSSRQEVNRTRYLTLGTAATEGFELLFPRPTILYWLDLPNEKNMHDQDISSKPLPNGGSTLGQHRHRKKIKKSLTACPPCHVVASTSSGPDTAPLGSDSDILHDDDKPPKRSSKKKVNKWKQCRRATGDKLNLLPELPCEEHIDTASPVEVFLPDLLADKLSDASSSACSLVKDAHLGKHNGESNNEYVEHGSDGKDGSGCAGSSNITVSERVGCKDVHLSGAHAEDVTDSSSHSERVQCSSEACSSTTFLPASPGRSGRKSRNKSSCTNMTATNRVVGSNRHKHSGKDSPVSVWQKVEKPDKENSSGAGHVVVSAVEDKIALEDDSKGVQHDPNRPMDKHRCRKNCKQHKKQTLFLYEQTSLPCNKGGCPSPRNYYAPKNGSPKTPKNHSQQTEGLSMLQPVCARDISDTSITTGTEKATLASYNLDSHLVPQATSKEPCTSVIQDDSHSLCLENKAISTDLDSRNLSVNPCAAEMEETQCVKSNSAAVHMSHKWVPIGKKDITHLDVPEASVVEASVPANDVSVSANIQVQRNVSDAPASTKCEGSEVATELTATPKLSGQLDSKCQGHTGNGTVFSKIREAVSDAHRAQQSAEDIQLHIGRPLADFEQFIYSASPVLHCSSCPTGCSSSSQEWVRDGLCCHQIADISLSSIWQWYEEPGCYGLEVKAQDLRRSKGFWNSRYQFNAYFVPYLSAVQLFRQPKRTVDKDEADMGARSKTTPCMSSLPILAKLLPQESNKRNSSPAFHDKDDQQLETTELIFEFFESEQPFWRRQLFDRVKELIGGAKQSNCQISGDPKNLELNLHDLHPASWYCVAWYPIYRIPDGKFQAAFLTYHSLGHWVRRGSSSDQAGHSHAVLPVMGLQSYNDKGEWWFQTSRSGSEDAESSSSQPSQVLEERLSTLNQTAAAMARADVWKKDQARRNRHPDYEFFLSRQQR